MTVTVEHETPVKLWANSADSHFIEPADLWRTRLPKRLAELVPRVEKDADGRWETIYVDGQVFRRRLPSVAQQEFMAAMVSAAGSHDVSKRLADLDQEGIWSELVFPSLGMWSSSFRTPELLREALKASNDWAKETLMDYSPRLIPTAQVSTLDIDDAVSELQRCAAMGFNAVFLPVAPHPAQRDYHQAEWEPFWTTAEDLGMVIAFHIGTEPIDFAGGGSIGVTYHGPGGAVLNYTETSFGGQRAVMKLVACGALDRHPSLKVLVSEGGATWVPFIADRMEEGYRQHAMVVRPKLSRSPREIIYSQVYASFQHDASAIAAVAAMGFNNVLWGSDYPHIEGTFGHTQSTLHELFDEVDHTTRDRVLFGAFNELFPGAPLPPAPGAVLNDDHW
ncbi:amidohydrolase family protein [Mycobacterium xenopi]|uniref:Amidohydrolase n=1 Tax=Mycobacterium xenopi TaxID=1789 RepID=A0AAD1GYR4_MYCXE|nr:amidohydrolase family protein [Mycobacterium xenopi]MDA3640901.1 amidohydrolase family protein [Mycobacterium xenopi]MDA3659090.1 amidohydrolase family protein [Mycobacterium xenopi]MDA3663145.1 amidohydrolase family protein [Mycobacterium xenopi]ORX21208.1 amidohydrolase [Mycobacterium xenopi]SPX78492.1 amidohydrolase 2 [Mycobacterium xenopi]